MSKKEEHRTKLLSRLRRVEGQVRGIHGMIEKDASCEAVAQQLAAARKALDRTFFEMVACSMELELSAAPNAASARQITGHLTQLLAKYG
jgi:DNA-binding FrmR family transcriptional regulator